MFTSLFSRFGNQDRKGARMFFHVGYPRTSTTWLQTDIFPKLRGVNYMGYRYEKPFWYQTKLVSEIVLEDDAVFDADRCRRAFSKLMKPNETNVFSSEAFLSPYDLTRTVKRLAAIAEQWDTHILIGLRRQDTFAFSVYCHQLKVFQEPIAKHKGITDFPAYSIESATYGGLEQCRWPLCKMSEEVPLQMDKSSLPCACLTAGAKAQPLWYLDLYKTVKTFEEVFAKDRVHLILLEDTEEDPLRTLRFLGKILPSKCSDDELQELAKIEKRNFLNKSAKYDFSKLSEEFFNPETGLAKRLMSDLAESNAQLQNSRPELNLKAHAYF